MRRAPATVHRRGLSAAAFSAATLAVRKRHAQLIQWAQDGLQAALAPALLPDPSSSDPFKGLLPWELTSAQALAVPRGEDGTIDTAFGAALFDYAGVCHLPRAVSAGVVGSARDAAVDHTSAVLSAVRARGMDPDAVPGFRFHEACQRGPGRYDMRIGHGMGLGGRDVAPFQEAGFGERAAWMPLVRTRPSREHARAPPCCRFAAPLRPQVRRILGGESKLLFRGLVVSDPGASEQALHSDGPHVPTEVWRHFEGGEPHGKRVTPLSEPRMQQMRQFSRVVGPSLVESARECPSKEEMRQQLPPHCLTVFVPLVALTKDNGATRYLPGSHHQTIATAGLEAEAEEAVRRRAL